MTVPPFQFGVVANGQGTGKEWYDLARRVESLGYDMLLVTDHVRQPLAPTCALAAAAAVTSRLGLGTYVLNNDLRNPVMMVNEMATVDALSCGRAILGLGAGWLDDDYARTGTTFRSGRERLEGLRHSVAVARAAGPPGMPVMVGGARRGALALAAQEADIVSFVPPFFVPAVHAGPACLSPVAVDRAVAWVGDAASGRAVPPVLNYLVWECYVTSRPERVFAALAQAVGASACQVGGFPCFLAGSVDQLVETLGARRERFGFSLVTVPVAAAERFAPVAQQLSGT